MYILKDKIAVITGGAQGIGAAISKRFSAEGAKTIILDIDCNAFDKNFNNKKEFDFHTVDLTSESNLFDIKEDIKKKYKEINILVNNAAILDATKLEDLNVTHFNFILNNNLNSLLNSTMTFLELFKVNSYNNKILNISSIMGMRGSKDSIPYSTAKAAIINFTQCLAVELGGKRICVNSISPGFINTRMALLTDGSGHEYETDFFKDTYLKHQRIPLVRTGLAEDISGPACFLCSNDSDYITGQNLSVDGGLSSIF